MSRSVLLALSLLLCASPRAAEAPPPLKVLLVTGGCCHDYGKQKNLLKKGLEAAINVSVDVVHQGGSATDARIELYANKDWAKGYDAVIHDECFADVKDTGWVDGVLAPHRAGLPAVNLHCAMHCYRTGKDDWFAFLGLHSTGHGPQQPIAITYVDREHPITKPLRDWTTINEELYNNVRVFDTAHVLAEGAQGGGKAVVTWINQYGNTRVFNTTIGHNSETVADPRYLEKVARGLLWACDRLNSAYLQPRAPQPGDARVRPNLAVAGTATASSVQPGNAIGNGNDNDESTRWCANGDSAPQWWAVDLGAEQAVTGFELVWENAEAPYRYTIETSADGKVWTRVVDQSQNKDRAGTTLDEVAAKARHVRVNFLGSLPGQWGSLWEVRVLGEPGAPGPPVITGGNDKASRLLREVKVAEGFEASVFATPDQANYPVFVAAAPDGTLYVSSDGNGSLDRNANRGRIVRLRDTDGDGRADEVKDFVKNLDSPRGLLWDHDRLYVLHPPHLSVFPDLNADGEADGQTVLVRDIAFGFKDRPADHTTNGISLGVDGWIYIACGDFGFLKAVGADGRELQLRGGGVARVRPDGTGLDLYTYGTRNILEVAVGPLLDMFARDNTNDGGGWDLRFETFTGLDDHGYPKLFRNFPDEVIKPLAVYGGGSGCGAAWIDEPGFPAEWNDKPYTSDWGRSPVFRHTVKASGASFEEVGEPVAFATVPRSTDLDVDAHSRAYVSSWKGATFNWAGPQVGFIAQVKPAGYSSPALPDYAKASPAELVKELESASHRRRLEAQRALVRLLTAGKAAEVVGTIEALSGDQGKPLASRVVALYALQLGLGVKSHAVLARLAADPTVAAWAIRALTNDERQLAGLAAAPLLAGLKSADARVRKEALISLARLGDPAHAPAMTPLLADSDPTVAHTAYRALGHLKAATALLAVLDQPSPATGLREGAVRAIQLIHTPAAVDGLIARLASEKDPARRKGLITALCRLHSVDGVWKGDSWGTRPDTRGPYYQPEDWAETPKIAAALSAAMQAASAEETAFLGAEFARHRLNFGDSVGKLIEVAAKDDSVLPALARQLATADSVPAAAMPHLAKAALDAKLGDAVRAQAVQAIAKGDSADGFKAALAALGEIASTKSDGVEVGKAKSALLDAPRLENHHGLFEQLAATGEGAPRLWATAILLKLSAAKTGAPEPREMAGRTLDTLWAAPAGRVQVLEAALLTKDTTRAEWFVDALADANADVAKKAGQVTKALKVDPVKVRAARTGPTVASLPVAQVLDQVMQLKGDAKRGEMLFTQQGCVACHTTAASQPLKGPYLGNIATTYPRRELAEHILDPGKSLAQGFVTHLFTLRDGSAQMGFVTFRSAERVSFRNIAAQETTVKPSDIVKEEEVKQSLMPAGLAGTLTVGDFASLLDYLEALAKEPSK